MPVVLEQKR